MSNVKEIIKEKERRINELQTAKAKLEQNKRIHDREVQIACYQAKRQAQKELATKFLKVLPNSNSNLQVSTRVLINDIRRVLKEYE